ncbi:hypothetical protein DM860_007460 [Cuscuta australis]|uniref:Uncharacterized protein n=1 Tax=Cuscuta australis TaxID=267555 RepID=A0A328E3W5_9ASTE|nr:hypothetical protein DM860_007460 [Cuscuta australis]
MVLHDIEGLSIFYNVVTYRPWSYSKSERLISELTNTSGLHSVTDPSWNQGANNDNNDNDEKTNPCIASRATAVHIPHLKYYQNFCSNCQFNLRIYLVLRLKIRSTVYKIHNFCASIIP